jgi:hypothetical protein
MSAAQEEPDGSGEHDGAGADGPGYSVADVLGNSRIVVDLVAPPLLFVGVATALDLVPAVIAALAFSAVVLVVRAVRGDGVLYAIGGAGGVVTGALFALWSGATEGFFGPDVALSAIYAVVAVVSILVRRPLVAWTSWLIYRWPRDWYWHPKVRPAYSEITWLWALLFGGRAIVQYVLLQRGEVGWLTIANLATGLPAIVLLLVATYAYVTLRLERLGGPDVEEFRAREGDPAAS